MMIKWINNIEVSFITCILITSLTFGCISLNDNPNNINDDENKAPKYSFEYLVEIRHLNGSYVNDDYYLIVPFPSKLNSILPEAIVNNLEISSGHGSFNINNSFDMNNTYYDIGLQINTSGNITIRSVGTGENANFMHMSLIIPNNNSSSVFFNYLIYSSYLGNLSVYIYCKTTLIGANSIKEKEAEIFGIVTYGWNQIEGTEKYLTD